MTATMPIPAIEEIYNVETEYKLKDGTTMPIKIKHSISLVDMSICVNNIVSGIIDESDYKPYFYNILHWRNILEKYTDFDTNIGFEETYRIINESDITDVLTANISESQSFELSSAVKNLIEFEKQKLIHKSNLMN